MTKIYIVRGSSGEYSDHTEWDVVACTSKAHANRIAGKLTGLMQHNLECGRKTHTENDNHSVPEHLQEAVAYSENKEYYSDAEYNVHTVELIDDQSQG
jgi:hypothetical protein